MATKDISDKLVCEAYAAYRIICDEAWKQGMLSPQGAFPYDILQVATGQPFKVCYRAMERAADRDLIEYGVSLRTGWLTEKGKKLLGLPTRPPVA